MRIEGRDGFLDVGAFPSDATTIMVAEAYQGEIGFQMYDATKGSSTVRVVEQLRVKRQDRQFHLHHRHDSLYGTPLSRGRPRRPVVNRNPEVDIWFEDRKPPLAAALQRARQIILDTDDRITETIKWGTPTFVYKGNILSFTPSKTSVGLMFHTGAELPGDHPRLEGDNRLVRTMRFADLADVESGRAHIEKAIVAWCDWKDSA